MASSCLVPTCGRKQHSNPVMKGRGSESMNFLYPGTFALRFFKEVCGYEPILVVGIDQNLPLTKSYYHEFWLSGHLVTCFSAT